MADERNAQLWANLKDLYEDVPCVPLALYADEGTRNNESTLILTVMLEISPISTDPLAVVAAAVAAVVDVVYTVWCLLLLLLLPLLKQLVASARFQTCDICTGVHYCHALTVVVVVATVVVAVVADVVVAV